MWFKVLSQHIVLEWLIFSFSVDAAVVPRFPFLCKNIFPAWIGVRSSERGGTGYGNYFKLVLRENIQSARKRERGRASESFLLTTFPLIPEKWKIVEGWQIVSSAPQRTLRFVSEFQVLLWLNETEMVFEFISKLIVFINELMRHNLDTNCGYKSARGWAFIEKGIINTLLERNTDYGWY